LTRICAVKKFGKKIFCRPTDPNFLAYVTGNIELFFTPYTDCRCDESGDQNDTLPLAEIPDDEYNVLKTTMAHLVYSERSEAEIIEMAKKPSLTGADGSRITHQRRPRF
jgi:hypothetical protein